MESEKKKKKKKKKDNVSIYLFSETTSVLKMVLGRFAPNPFPPPDVSPLDVLPPKFNVCVCVCGGGGRGGVGW